MYDATNTKKDNTGMTDGQELDADDNDQISGINNDASQINEVVSSSRDANVSEGIMEVDQEGGTDCRPRD